VAGVPKTSQNDEAGWARRARAPAGVGRRPSHLGGGTDSLGGRYARLRQWLLHELAEIANASEFTQSPPVSAHTAARATVTVDRSCSRVLPVLARRQQVLSRGTCTCLQASSSQGAVVLFYM
jgi:hypothetical protein